MSRLCFFAYFFKNILSFVHLYVILLTFHPKAVYMYVIFYINFLAICFIFLCRPFPWTCFIFICRPFPWTVLCALFILFSWNYTCWCDLFYMNMTFAIYYKFNIFRLKCLPFYFIWHSPPNLYPPPQRQTGQGCMIFTLSICLSATQPCQLLMK